MNLDRPLAFIDTETTGTDPNADRIVEIGVLKVYDLSGNRREFMKDRVNPTIPIKSSATAVHGIRNEDVADKATFAQVAQKYFDFIAGCDIAGFKSNSFDVPLLYNEFLRAGIEWDYSGVSFIDIGNIYARKYPRDLASALKLYCDREHKDAHGVAPDIRATLDVFIEQLKRHGDLPQDMAGLARYSNYDRSTADLSGKFSFDAEGDYVFTFGEHKDCKAKDWPDYLRWMIGKDFPVDTKRIAKNILKDQK